MIVYLDMDGVIADFVAAAAPLFGSDPDEVKNKVSQSGAWGIKQHLTPPVSQEDFWKVVNDLGEPFWTEMPAFRWHLDLFDACRRVSGGRTIICTAPSRSPASVSGKLRWMQKHHGVEFRDFIFIPRKELLAGPGAVLIDDRKRNVDRFIQAGGAALHFDSTWADPVGRVSTFLRCSE